MRILIAEDDEALARFVRQGLEAERYTVDVVADGEQARTEALDSEYDIVILDLNLPRLDGVTVLRHLRAKKPTVPVLVLTQRNRVEDRVQCLDTGADDYIPKRLSGASLDIDHIRNDLIARIRAAALTRKSSVSNVSDKKPVRSSRTAAKSGAKSIPEIVAIGTSTGGPRALQEILPRFTRDLPVPLLIVQHMPEGFSAPFAERLNNLCSIHVSEAKDGEVIRPGAAYIAPYGSHMSIIRRASDLRPVISLDSNPRGAEHVPSIDVLMKSLASLYKSRAMGIIMTGMGSDGAEGMKAIHRAGGFTIGQDEATCTVYGMPRVCAEMGILDRIVPLSRIPAQVTQSTLGRRQA
jgi:two-component system, chemotaxis family, protein-glutamate methylesterase/glutaminase